MTTRVVIVMCPEARLPKKGIRFVLMMWTISV
jgi:hypothetical protein